MNLRQLEIVTKVGTLTVPAADAITQVPHLAVTMTRFGLFEVTHVPSSYVIVGGFERATNAYIAMVEAQLALDELQINLSQGWKLLKTEIIAKDRKCESIGMSFRQWIDLHGKLAKFSSEFPWENEEDSPLTTLKKLIEKLNKKNA